MSRLGKRYGDVPRRQRRQRRGRAAGPGDGLARAQRRRQDHDLADAARARCADQRHRDVRRQAVRRAADPVRQVGAVLEASGCHPGRTALTTSASWRPRRAAQGRARRVLAEPGSPRTRGGGSASSPWDAAAAGARRGDARRPGGARPGRTDERPRPARACDGSRVRPPAADEGRTVLVSSHALSEVEQTADHVLADRPRAAAPVVDPRRAARRGGRRLPRPHARPRPASAVLDAAGHTLPPRRTRSSRSTCPGAVGELAAAHGIVLHRWPRRRDLEQAFFKLVEQSGPIAEPPIDLDGRLVKALVDAELLKLRSARLVAGLLIAMRGLVVVIVLVNVPTVGDQPHGSSLDDPGAARPRRRRQLCVPRGPGAAPRRARLHPGAPLRHRVRHVPRRAAPGPRPLAKWLASGRRACRSRSGRCSSRSPLASR